MGRRHNTENEPATLIPVTEVSWSKSGLRTCQRLSGSDSGRRTSIWTGALRLV